MTGNLLPQVKSFLANGLATDTTLSLATAVAWLDPLRVGDGDTEVELPPLINGLKICAESFPDLYEELMHELWKGIDADDVAVHLSDGLSRYLEYSEIDAIEDLSWGIPVYLFGMDWWDGEEDVHDHPFNLIPIIQALGGEISDDGSVELGHLESVARLLYLSLDEFPLDTPHHDVDCLLRWLDNSTDCDFANWTRSEWNEGYNNHIEWSTANLQWVNRQASTAAAIYRAAHRGADLINETKEWGVAFIRNANIARRHVERIAKRLKKGTSLYEAVKTSKRTQRLVFDWPGCSTRRHPRNTGDAA